MQYKGFPHGSQHVVGLEIGRNRIGIQHQEAGFA
jgi:hypothetical protein